MRDYETELTQEELKRILDYDPDTGIFTWKVCVSRSIKIGDLAGCKQYHSIKRDRRPTGISIRISRHPYYAHRLAWLYMTGEWPIIIDHDDGNPFNNKWYNLNNGTAQDNSKNLPLRKDNTSGLVGVSWNRKYEKWGVKINVDNKTIHLGLFEDLSTAKKQREIAEVKYGFHPNHGRMKTS